MVSETSINQTVALDIPLEEPIDSQVDRIRSAYFDVQIVDRDLQRTARRVRAGLDKAGALLSNGRRVSTYGDAVLFLLEQVQKLGKE